MKWFGGIIIGFALALLLGFGWQTVAPMLAQDALGEETPEANAEGETFAFAVAVTMNSEEWGFVGSYYAHSPEISDGIRSGTVEAFITIPQDVTVVVNDGGVNPRYVITGDAGGSFVSFTPVAAGASSGFAVMTVEVACASGEAWVQDAVDAGKFDC